MRNFETDKLNDIKFSLRLFVFHGIGKAEVRRWTKIIEKQNGSVRATVTGMADYVIINPNGKTSITEYEKAKSWQRQGRQLQIFDVQDFRNFMEEFEPALKKKTGSRTKSNSFQSLDPAEKQDIAMAYLAGTSCVPYEEEAVIRYIKRNKIDFLKHIFMRDADQMMAVFLKLYRKISLTDLDGYLNQADGKSGVTAVLLQYKQRNYTWEQILKADMAKEEKAMGLRELSVADWKQVYRFTAKKEGIVLTEYLDKEPYLEMPVRIGRKPVIGVQPGTFLGKSVKSINSAYMIPLKDYYGKTEAPELYIPGEFFSSEQKKRIVSAQPGDILTFGRYTGTADAGEQLMEWQVIDRDGERLFLLALHAVECLPFDVPRKYSQWNDSALRNWLNGIFLEQAFSEEEKERILKTKLSHPGNRELGIKGSIPTEDALFLMSYEEIKQYEEWISCQGTDYVVAQKRKNGIKESAYWLRTPGGNHRRAAVVTESGEYRRYGEAIYNSDCLVRPAMWISAAEV